MATIEDFRARLPSLRGMEDADALDVVHQLYFSDMDRAAVAQRIGLKVAPPPPPPVEPTGFLRTQGDRALALGQGVVGGVKMLTDLAGPGNPVSETLGAANRGMQSMYSPARLAEMGIRQQAIEDADASGSTWDQVKTRLGGIAEAPLQTGLQALGSMAPTIAATIASGGIAPAAGVLSSAARLAAPLAIGTGMGVGSVKGQNYDAVLQKAKQEGYSDAQAQALAVQASEYSAANAPQQALGGALGALDAGTGVEHAIRNVIAKPGAVASKAAPGMMARIARTAGAEALPEGAQGAQGQYAQNEAMNRVGFPTDPMSGVVGSGVHDATVGAMLGAGAGIPKPATLTKAATLAPPPAAPPTPPAPIPLTPEADASLKDMANKRAAELDEKAKGTKDTKAGDRIIPGKQPEFLTPAEKEERDFLTENGGDTQALARVYTATEPDGRPVPPEEAAPEPLPPIDDQAVIARMERQQQRDEADLKAAAFAEEAKNRPAAPEPPSAAPGDILNKQGNPFTSKPGAMKAQREAGPDHEVVRVTGGFVVRKKETPNEPLAQPTTEPAMGNASGPPDDAGGTGAATALGPVGQPAPAAAEPEQRSTEAVLAGEPAEPDAALTPATASEPISAESPTDAPALADDLPTLRNQWREAVKADDKPRIAAINAKIDALKAQAAATPPAAELPDSSVKADEPTRQFTGEKAGDFYEVRGDNAREAAKVLGLTLTSRNGTPQVGWPTHAHERSVSALAAAGIEFVDAGTKPAEPALARPVAVPARAEPTAEERARLLAEMGQRNQAKIVENAQQIADKTGDARLLEQEKARVTAPAPPPPKRQNPRLKALAAKAAEKEAAEAAAPSPQPAPDGETAAGAVAAAPVKETAPELSKPSEEGKPAAEAAPSEKDKALGDLNDALGDLAAEPTTPAPPRAAKLRELGVAMVEKAQEDQNRDRNTNTARRANMATGAEADARAREAMGKTLQNLADAIESGQADKLAGITSKAQVETLESTLRRSMADADRGLSYVDRERQKGRAPDANDVRNARIPQPSWNFGGATQTRLLEAIKGKKGSKEVAALIGRSPSAELLAGLKRIGVSDKDIQYGLGWVNLEYIADTERLKRAGINTDADLREALTQYIEHRDGAKKEDPIKAAERKLIGQKVGLDFFPTPKAVAQQMVQMAGIEAGDRVLEPSAGNGNIADAARAAGATVDVVEISGQLRELLEAKGYTLAGNDFMQFDPAEKYDAVLMNPPFSNRLDAEHIQRAYGMLKPGGRLVAIAGEGVFFGSDVKAKAFREWLDERSADVSKLPAGTFKDSQLLAQTGTNARLLMIEKPDDAGNVALFSRKAPPTLAAIESAWEARGIQSAMHEKNGIITLGKIIVPKGDRNKGIGTAAMQELLEYADQTGQQIALTPSGDFGGNKARLAAFYRGLGFRTYKGFVVRETMIRDPEPLFSRGNGQATVAQARTAAVRELGDDVTEALEKAGLLTFAQTPRAGMPSDVAGATQNGRISLYADNTAPDSAAVLYHEALHATLLKTIGQETYDALMARLTKMSAGSVASKYLAEALDRIPADTPAAARASEIASYLVEQYQTARERMPVPLRRWVGDFLAAIKAGLAKALAKAGIGLKLRVAIMTDPAVLRVLARDGLRNLAREQGMRSGMAPAFSRSATDPALLTWATAAMRGRPQKQQAVVLTTGAPHRAFEMLGAGARQPVVIDAEHARHIANTHPDVTPEMIASLPDLLSDPRAVIRDRPGHYEVFVAERDAAGRPYMVALQQEKADAGGNVTFKVVGIKTMFAPDASLAHVLRAAQMKTGAVWLPSQEVSKVEGLRSGSVLADRPGDQPGSVPPRPTGLSGTAAAVRGGQTPSMTAIVWSDEALRKFIAGDPKWREEKVTIGVPRNVGDAAFSRAPATDTSAFRAWFGDSVVTENGKAGGVPLVVYHGTGADFGAFDAGRIGANFGDPDGFFFTNNTAHVGGGSGRTIEDMTSAGAYAKNAGGAANIMPVYVSLKNPKIIQGDTDGAGILSLVESRNKGAGYAVKQTIAEGHDGIIIRDLSPGSEMDNGQPETVVVAFRPEQIKSATGNRGTFDAGNPDIRYSRAIGAALTAGTNSVKDVRLPAGYKVGDLMGGAGRLSWWHKTVGTQYNLAQKSAPFKRVFDAVQNFISDTTFYAAEAADLAPNVLPKLDGIRDILKTPLSAADTKALSAPVFEGTLTWGRDDKGRLRQIDDLKADAELVPLDDKARALMKAGHVTPDVLRMWQGMPMEQYEKIIEGKYEREFVKAGVVFTDAELKKHFNLTDAQIGLYRETRAAIDKSLTDLAVSEMVRMAGKDGDAVRADALDLGDADKAAELLRDHLFDLAEAEPDRADVLNATANKMIDIADRTKDLKAHGYAPLSRFGSHTLEATLKTGERYFSMFDSPRERNRMQRMLVANGATGITAGTMSQEEHRLLNGISPETAALFGDMLGLDDQGSEAKDLAYQTFLKNAIGNRSAMKRLIHRQGIAGFSEDAGRVLASFVTSNGRKTSANLHSGEITEAVEAMPKEGGEVKDAAVRLQEYVRNPQEEAPGFRGLLFAQYLGGSVASAMVNATQPFVMTFPYLSQYGGARKAASQLAAAAKDAIKGGSTGDTALDAELKRAEEDGTVSPQEIHSLQAQAMGKAQLRSGDGTKAGDALAKAQNAAAKLSLVWGKVFGVAEQFNRRTTFIAAYRTAVEQGIAEPAAFARKAVVETQGLYNKGNKPRWARGAIGSVLFTFKQYGVAYMEMLHRMATAGEPGSDERKSGQRAALLALAVLFMMAGSEGLPFIEDAEDLIDGAMQRLGYNFSTKQKKREFFAGVLGTDGAEFVMNGLSGLPGVPIDFSGRTGMGNLIPGTGLFQKKTDHTRDLVELAGPAGDFAKRAFNATEQALQGDLARAAMTISPTASRNVAKGVDMASTGMYRDDRGRKVVDATPVEAAFKAIGFQPRAAARVSDAGYEVERQKAQYTLVSSEIRDKWARGLFEGDKELVQDARDDMAAWNRNNPEQKITANLPAILRRVREMRKPKEQRLADTAPKAIRAEVRAQLAEAAR